MSDVMEPFVYRLGVAVPHGVIFVTVHHSVKILPNEVFCERRQLKEVTLLEGLEEIGENAFCDCESLERINFPSSLIKIGLIKIGKDAFEWCCALKEVTLPEGLEEIGEYTFRNCISLERINYPSSLIKIGDGAFHDCHSLKEVMLLEGLEEIGEYAFDYCISLERINYPSTLIKIGTGAFARCCSLVEVTLAGGIVTIEANAFQCCNSLPGITIPFKAFIVEVDSVGVSDGDSIGDSEGNLEVFTCRLVLTNDVNTPLTLTNAQQMIISPEHLNYISSPDLLELQMENIIITIMNNRGHTREENIERVLALIKSRALFEVSTMLELALWKNKMNAIDESNLATRADCRVMCGGDDIIPGVMSYL